MLNKLKISALVCSLALVLSACSTNSTTSAPSTAPVDQIDHNTFDADVAYKDLAKLTPKVVKSSYFVLGIPDAWQIISFEDQELNTHISVERIDRSAIVTIKVNKASFNTIEERCDHAKAGFKANGLVFSDNSSVQYGSCIISGHENDKESAIWIRQYDDDKSEYSISYTGSLEVVGELLGYLSGNDKLMQLMVRPL